MSYKYAEEFFMFLIMREYDHQQQQHKHSRYRKDYYKKLDAVRRRLRSRRIPRVALHDPPNSAWNRLYLSGNDQGLITLTGLDFPTFLVLPIRVPNSTLPVSSLVLPMTFPNSTLPNSMLPALSFVLLESSALILGNKSTRIPATALVSLLV